MDHFDVVSQGLLFGPCIAPICQLPASAFFACRDGRQIVIFPETCQDGDWPQFKKWLSGAEKWAYVITIPQSQSGIGMELRVALQQSKEAVLGLPWATDKVTDLMSKHYLLNSQKEWVFMAGEVQFMAGEVPGIKDKVVFDQGSGTFQPCLGKQPAQGLQQWLAFMLQAPSGELILQDMQGC